ncbi:MAG TPA: pyridoxamine 5'-phosphate oxidase family protein [Actinomycetes bacterium]|jgi:PPOX class probable F420-dependent enzyme|nr:pyridoxamine 5'-phosphate oxidase family protein [Actinomycetota bacterium]HEX2157192.1 pyridoxamine 5'-phosphate oxidase family protein [Actinomycetes bacterium]
MDRRRQIRMTEAELAAFLDEQQTVICATIGPGGRPHLTVLWYVPAPGHLDCWTYAASQKARNLERDPRATLLTESGTTYEELRGASLECDAELVRDPGRVLDIGVALAARYRGLPPAPDLRAALSTQAAKRVGIRFHPTRVSSWDHRKLG